jgi:hemolysin III
MGDAASNMTSTVVAGTEAARSDSGTARSGWYPQARRVEWIADLVVHIVSLTLAVAGSIVMISVAAASGASPRLTAALIIYSTGLIAMLVASTICNANTNQGLARLLGHFDLSGIFLMIAGSYTPFMLAKLDGPMAWGLLAVVWMAALLGVALNLLARWHAPRVYITLYLLLGWAGLAIIEPLVKALSPTGMTLLAVGGALYTIGVVFHVNKRLPFSSAIWHGFVLAAAACHFGAIWLEVLARAA